MNQHQIPILERLLEVRQMDPVSFHVPGHKHGRISPVQGRDIYQDILSIDMTELPGLDDLHAPEDVILAAEELAADYFHANKSFFLIGGSTVGNLAMILSTCRQGETVLIQRNCHKSIMNGLELSGAKPVFLAPEYDRTVDRYTAPSLGTVMEAVKNYPDAKALVLTYPDYFGKTSDIKAMIDAAHAADIPVLVDEAHGVHFSSSAMFPDSALAFGADMVVQSAHKMAPAMTMTAFLHMNTSRINKEEVAHYLQMVQSSSPSYPLMASLDMARHYLATVSATDVEEHIREIKRFEAFLDRLPFGDVVPADDPLKTTFHVKQSYSPNEIARLLEKDGIFVELVTDRQLLFTHGLVSVTDWERVKKCLTNMCGRLKKSGKHATIEVPKLFSTPIQEMELSYMDMQGRNSEKVDFESSIGKIAAEAVIPYPPGIPYIVKGERITSTHLDAIRQLRESGVRMQQRETGIRVFTER